MQAGLRYCGECGRPQLDTSTFQAVVLGTGLSSDAGRATTGGSRVCPRCRGASDPSATFCRYCGLPLTGPSIHGAPAPALALASSFTPGGTAVALSPTPAPVAPAQAPRPAAAPTPLVSTASMVEATAARLVVIARDGTEGPSFPLGEVTDIGRAEGQIVVADDRHLSPRHARITFRGGVFLLSDLGSTNGLFVRIPFSPAAPLRPQVASVDRAARSKEADAEHPLEDQDLFLVGQQVLRFEVVNDTEQGFRVAFDNGTLLFGTPVTARHARLIQVGVEGGARDVYYLRKAETIIGRESGDIVFTDDPFLSRRHATVRMHGGGTGSDGARASRRFVLADLGSSNGTFLQTRGEVVLKPGDQFRVGQQLFRFDLGGPRVDA
jgi:pSer/pThr/pTyr-binding forkhead associated (FHA) protein